jgi:NADH:ubiquinone oxidoreductase subunit 2 (subunit N)
MNQLSVLESDLLRLPDGSFCLKRPENAALIRRGPLTPAPPPPVFGKSYIVAAGASSAIRGLIVPLVLSSVVGLFYYLLVVTALYERDAADSGALARLPRLSWSGACVLVAIAVILVWAGLYPGAFLHLVRSAP